MLGRWSDGIETFLGSPIQFAHAIGLLDFPTLLAHVNYCSDEELALLARGRASVVYCPRTHQYFGHPPHRFREMLKLGINVSLATDSCASSPDLNLLDELRLVHKLHPDLPPTVLFQLITLNAARAITWDNRIGSLAPGTHADFAIFPAAIADPLLQLLKTTALPSQVWVDGKCHIA